jgi:hypothetical protein
MSMLGYMFWTGILLLAGHTWKCVRRGITDVDVARIVLLFLLLLSFAFITNMQDSYDKELIRW